MNVERMKNVQYPIFNVQRKAGAFNLEIINGG